MHLYQDVQKAYEEEEELEKDTAHNIATEDLNQDTYYCQWRALKENMGTNPIKAYFALQKMHKYGEEYAEQHYDDDQELESGTGAKTAPWDLDDAHKGCYKDYRIVDHYLLSQCPPGTKQALEFYQGYIRHMEEGMAKMFKEKPEKYGVFDPSTTHEGPPYLRITPPKGTAENFVEVLNANLDEWAARAAKAAASKASPPAPPESQVKAE
jgi:hypothetical protein